MTVTRFRQSVSSDEAVQPFDLSDRGLLLGDGVFDTSLVVDGRMVLRARHIERLMKACAALGLAPEDEELSSLIDRTLSPGDTGALRLTVTRGPGGRGLDGETAREPTLLASFRPLQPDYPAPPIRLGLSTIRRNPTAPSSRYKTLAYTDAVVGHRQARAEGFDDALYCTMDTRVACSSVANIFACFGDHLITPPPGDGVIAGVMRGWILEHAGSAGYRACEESLSLEKLKTADTVFLTNSLRLLVPVSAINEIRFDPGIPDQLTGIVRRLVIGSD